MPCLVSLSLPSLAETRGTDIYLPAGFVSAFKANRAVGDIEVTWKISYDRAADGKLDNLQKSHVTLIPGSIPM